METPFATRVFNAETGQELVWPEGTDPDVIAAAESSVPTIQRMRCHQDNTVVSIRDFGTTRRAGCQAGHQWDWVYQQYPSRGYWHAV